jgi:hypothetical protein
LVARRDFEKPQKNALKCVLSQKSALKTYRRFSAFLILWHNGPRDEKYHKTGRAKTGQKKGTKNEKTFSPRRLVFGGGHASVHLSGEASAAVNPADGGSVTVEKQKSRVVTC